MPQPGRPDRCLNCGALLDGRFCSRCGQRATDLNVPLSQLVSELLSAVVTFDTRIFRTLVPLVRRPGLLSVEYNAGRRASYVPPLTLYVFVSALMFLTLALSGYSVVVEATPSTIVIRNKPSTGPPEVVTLDEAAEDQARPAEARPAQARPAEARPAEVPDEEGDDGALGQLLRRTDEYQEKDRERFDADVLKYLARALFVLVPFFALLLKLLYRAPGRYYVQHLVFALYLHSFAFLMITAATGIGSLLGGGENHASKLAMPIILVYAFLALRRAYGEGRLRTALKLFVLCQAYLVLLVGSFIAAVAFTGLGA